MKFTWLLLILAVTPAWANVLGFSEWKTQREQEAQHLVDKAKQGEKSKGKKGKPAPAQDVSNLSEGGSRFRRVTDKTETPLVQAERNLTIARDLNVNDYFVLYLRTLPDPAFREAVEKLSKGEVGELLLAYRQRLNLAETAPAPLAEPGKDTDARSESKP